MNKLVAGDVVAYLFVICDVSQQLFFLSHVISKINSNISLFFQLNAQFFPKYIETQRYTLHTYVPFEYLQKAKNILFLLMGARAEVARRGGLGSVPFD